MPIEIKELHIRVAVNTPQGGQTTGGQGAAGGNPDTGNDSAGKEAIVADCVEQVLEILKNKMER